MQFCTHAHPVTSGETQRAVATREKMKRRARRALH
jgi:hypothetical protein